MRLLESVGTSHVSALDLLCYDLPIITVGPLIIESFWAKKRVSTGALEALDDPLVVQTKN